MISQKTKLGKLLRKEIIAKVNLHLGWYSSDNLQDISIFYPASNLGLEQKYLGRNTFKCLPCLHNE